MQRTYEAADNHIKRNLRDHLRFAYDYRAFFVYWIRRSIVTRYSQTTVGLLWAILQPLLSSLVYILVFSLIARVTTNPVPYPLFVITSLVLWNYWTRIVISGASSVVTNLDIVTRVSFPREFLPLGVAAEAMVDLLIGGVIVVVLFIVYQQPLTPYMLLAIPIFIIHTCLALGLAFFLAGVSSYIRDLFQILPILLQLLLYLSPVLYPITNVPEHLRALFIINPLAPIFAGYQETLLFGTFSMGTQLAGVGVIALVVLIVGYWYFKRTEWRFADTL
ncbi:MAG: ABC transporter permease [Chloroflexi bacterium]|nr:ABC transporter permease [Chloroflexota bacterium]MCC6895916.1 ABC transporter permease [Anaerolineae bacterium]